VKTSDLIMPIIIYLLAVDCLVENQPFIYTLFFLIHLVRKCRNDCINKDNRVSTVHETSVEIGLGCAVTTLHSTHARDATGLTNCKVTGYGLDNRASIPGRGKDFPRAKWGNPTGLSNGCRCRRTKMVRE
jgi:hypothetical protein